MAEIWPRSMTIGVQPHPVRLVWWEPTSTDEQGGA